MIVSTPIKAIVSKCESLTSFCVLHIFIKATNLQAEMFGVASGCSLWQHHAIWVQVHMATAVLGVQWRMAHVFGTVAETPGSQLWICWALAITTIMGVNKQMYSLSPRSLSSSLSLCLCKICPSNRDKSLEKSNKSQIAIYLRTVTLFITKWKIQGLYTQQQLIISSCHHFTEKRYLSSTLHCQKRRILETIVVRIWVCMWF